jgi:hypothetical protein
MITHKMQFTRTRLYKYFCMDICIYIYIYIYICICLRTYEVLEYDEYKLDKMFVKRTHNMLNIFIGV